MKLPQIECVYFLINLFSKTNKMFLSLLGWEGAKRKILIQKLKVEKKQN